MSNDTRPKESTGVRFVTQIVEEHWNSGFQPTSARTDDGIDGYIHLRRRGNDTGAVLFAQIKCGRGYRADTLMRPEFVGINVKKLEEHQVRWSKQPVPVVLIYVDPTKNIDSPEAWWTDLKDAGSFTSDRKNYVLLPKAQRFGKHSKGCFYRLCGHRVADQNLPRVLLSTGESLYRPLTAPLKPYARAFYKDWSHSQARERTNPALGEVIVNRVGWRHLCRKERKPTHIVQSWQLLGAARKIVTTVSGITPLGDVKSSPTSNGVTVNDFIGLRAWVSFPHRHESVVQVVLRRNREFAGDGSVQTCRVWFYSVYELRRHK